MGNKVRFTLTDTPINLTSINTLVVNAAQDTLLWSGVHPTTGGAVELDIGAVGVDGQAVWVYGNNSTAGTEYTSSPFGGYTVIEAEVTPPEDDTFLDENGAIYATSELNENSELWSNI